MIDEEALKEKVWKQFDTKTARKVVQLIRSMPKESERIGHWICEENGAVCSICGHRTTDDRLSPIESEDGIVGAEREFPHYCSYCGAKMK